MIAFFKTIAYIKYDLHFQTKYYSSLYEKMKYPKDLIKNFKYFIQDKNILRMYKINTYAWYNNVESFLKMNLFL